jgi:hypothetical protein
MQCIPIRLGVSWCPWPQIWPIFALRWDMVMASCHLIVFTPSHCLAF